MFKQILIGVPIFVLAFLVFYAFLSFVPFSKYILIGVLIWLLAAMYNWYLEFRDGARDAS